MASWSLDKSFAEKHKIVSAKASALGISEGEAYRLCVVEYETGIPLNEVTQQTKNAYNQYKLGAARPGTKANDTDVRKVAYELKLSDALAWQRAEALKMKASESVETRMEEKYGKEIEAGGFGSQEEFEKAMDEARKKDYWDALPNFRLPDWHMPDISFPEMPKVGDSIGGFKRSLQTTAVIVMIFFALLIYIIFVKGKGASGVTVGQVG